jgi:hypothetical protein
MLIIGTDYHPSFQQIAFFSEETGECGEWRLNHDGGEAERFNRDLKQRGINVRVEWRPRGRMDPQSSTWRGRAEQISLDQVGCEAEQILAESSRCRSLT